MSVSAELARAHEGGPLTPVLHRVSERRQLTEDVVTLALEPLGAPVMSFRPGQFNMLTAFGVGEVAISVSSAPHDEPLEHTVRDVGAVTHALCEASVGTVIGVRGAFGTDWDTDALAGEDVVVVAGGIGLAPLRGALSQLSAPSRGGRLAVLVGARRPDQVIFVDDFESWRQAGTTVEVAVDMADSRWTGQVGVVTSLVPRIPFDLHGAVALVCGPEIMMRFTIRALLERGLEAERIFVSLERNMQCGVGLCGHCQLGPYLLCRDGPVLRYSGALPQLMREHER